MRNLKKVLVLVLALAMMLSVMVMGAGAVFSDQSQIDSKHKDAVDMAVSLNIINGYPDGSFKPNDNVTREEMAKMICILDNGGKEPQLATGNTFSDVSADRWSNKYIEACASRGVVAGVGNGQFNPSGNVTATQAARMLLVELGYDEGEQNYTGPSWATNVNVDATKKGYYETMEDIDVSAPLTREHAAQMVWNALRASEIIYSYSANGAKVIPENKTVTGYVNDPATGFPVSVTQEVALITDKYGVTMIEGILDEIDYNSKNKDWGYTVGADTANSATDYSALLGMNVTMVWKYDDNLKRNMVMGIFAEDSSVLFSGLIGDLPNMDNDASNITFNDVKYKFDGNNPMGTPVYFFQTGNSIWGGSGASYTAPTTLDLVAGKAAGANLRNYDFMEFCAIDNDNDGKIDCFMVKPYEVVKISYVGSTDFRIEHLTNSANPVVTVNGDIETFKKEDYTIYDGMARGDYAIYTFEDNTLDGTGTFVKADLISGKVTTRDVPSVVVDGTSYKMAWGYPFQAPGPNAVGTQLTDVAVVNGYLFDGDLANKTKVTDYAVITAIVPKGGVDNNRAKLLFSDGTKSTVDLDKDYTAATAGDDYGKGQTAGNANPLAVGDLVTFDVNKDKEYELTYATAAASGFDMAKDTNADIAIQTKSTTDTKVGYINGYGIADDAVIFMAYDKGGAGTLASTDWKVITGATLKTMNTAGGTAVVVNPAIIDDSFVLGTNGGTGLGSVNLAYLYTAATDVSSADRQFAYVTNVATTQNSSGKDCYQYTLWTKDGELKLNTKNDTLAAFAAVAEGQVLVYTVNNDGDIDTIVADAPIAGVPGTANPLDRHTGTVAITGWNDAGATLAAKVGNAVAITGFDAKKLFVCDSTRATAVPNNMYFTSANGSDSFSVTLADDVQYIYIDNNDQSGVAGGAMSTANKMTINDFVTAGAAKNYSSYAGYAGEIGAASLSIYVQNAVLIYNTTGTEVECVVFDMNNDIMK